MKRLLFVIAMIGQLYASDIDVSKILTSTPVSNFGTEFWLSIPPCFTDESGGYANYIKFFVFSQVKTTVFLEVPGRGYQQIKSTVANDVIEFNVLPGVGQPYEKTGAQPYVPEQVFPGAGIHITSDQPVACYVVVRYKYTSDGFLALPVFALGKEYIIAGFNEEGMYGATYKLPNTTCIVAAYDDTQVEFTLGGNPVTITGGKMKPGESKTWTQMRKGDVLTVSTARGEADLSGSKVVASKPVAVMTGTFCTDIPTGNRWCDYTVEMDIPTYAWGKTYIVPKVPNRKFPSIIRIFAKEANTDIYRDSIKVGNIKKGGGIEGEGFLSMRMSKYSIPPTPPTSVVIRGDKSISVTLYNTGTEEDGGNVNSDPFVMAILPVEQFQKEIIFCTPGIAGSMGFPENYINLVYEANQQGQMPDDFEFANVIGGQYQWAKLRTKFPAQDELLPYKVNGKSYAVKLISLPGDGVYRIRSKTPFGAYSFGYSSYDSYGFPTAAGFLYLEKKDTIPPVPQYTLDLSGNVNGATVTDMPEDSKIRSNMSMIVFDIIQSYNFNFNYDDFIPGDVRTVAWELKIIDPSKDGKAVLLFVDRRGNDTTITITYKADSNPYNIRLISPKDSAIKQESALKFIWNKVGIPQYRLMIDENPGFNMNLKPFDLNDTTKLVSGLSPMTTYYWKVLSLRNDTILGSSKTWTFKTSQGIPQRVTLLMPKHESTKLKTNVNFAWVYSYKYSPDCYEIEVATDLQFKNIIFTKDSLLATSISTSLPKNSDYYWHVRGKNDIGIGLWSNAWNLNVSNDAPRLKFPADSSINVNLDGTAKWENIAAPAYHLQLSTTNDFLNLIIDSNNLQTNSCDFSLVKNQIYYWRVRAIYSNPEDWSEVWKFETIPNSPTEFYLTSPPDKSIRQEYNPTLRWTNAGKYVEYSVYISLDSNIVHDLSVFTVKEEHFTPTLVPGLIYYWKVKAKNASGDSESSQKWSFKTGTILGIEYSIVENSINISPNPATDFIEISVGAGSEPALTSDVRIYDVLGEIQTTPSLRDTPHYQGGEKVRIDVSCLAPGMYFVRVGDRVQKFVKL